MTETEQVDPAITRAIAAHLTDSKQSVLLLSGSGLFEFRRDKFGTLKRQQLSTMPEEVHP